jgi:serine/threonine-protein kinase
MVAAPLAAPPAQQTGVVPAVWDNRPEEPSGPRTGLLIGLALLVLAIIVAGVLLMPKLFNHKAAQICIDSTVNGMQPAAAQTKLSGLSTSVQPKTGTAQNKGQIIDVVDSNGNEAIGRCFNNGAAVVLIKSVGPANVSVPDVRGYTQQGAQNALSGAPYNLTVTVKQVFDPTTAGNVLSTDPAAGTSVAPGSAITITVSRGPQPTVPSELGQMKDAATSALQALGYKVRWQADPTSSQPSGTVTNQDPAGGTAVQDPTQTTVTLFISSGPSTGPTDTTTPNPTDTPS